MLETRHEMSQTVRDEVSPKSNEWGYKLGSVYIRKVHFRDTGMIKQIEEKVVNRLRQVTSAIRQDGANQVNIIKSTAEREAAVAFAKAASMRSQIVGKALQTISEDPRSSTSSRRRRQGAARRRRAGQSSWISCKEVALCSRLRGARTSGWPFSP
jgi:regulator of protease activity HflC (stomatin/prohibitin superfamily)